MNFHVALCGVLLPKEWDGQRAGAALALVNGPIHRVC